jgi:hypothetical protein
MPKEKLPALAIFDAQIVQVPLRGLLLNMDRDLERLYKQQTRPSTGTMFGERKTSLFLIMMRVTINAYQAICFLISTEGDAPRRKKKFALVVPSINRHILDLLFTLVYMLDDFPARSLAYELSAYRQLREEYDQFRNRYARDSKRKKYFADLLRLRHMLERYLPITPEQRANPKLIEYWYAPNKLKDKPTKSRPFMRFLDKWLYGETSAVAHLNAGGLFSIGGMVMADLAPEEIRGQFDPRAIDGYIHRHFTRTLITVLAIASEIDTFCQLNNREQISRIWGLLNGYVPEAKDVYKKRYEAMLA